MNSTARETLRKLAPVLGEARVNQLWRAYLIADGTEKRDLEGMFEAQAATLLKDTPSASPAGLFPPPPPERCLGDDIDLGRVLYGGQEMFLFGLRKQELLRHVGVYGSSGCGKSNSIALLVDGLIRERVPFILLDFKRSFRGLLRDYPKLLVFTAGDAHTAPFRFNPLIPPPGTSIEVWSKKVLGALSHAYCQGAGSESIVISALGDAYRDAARQKRWPTFKDVAYLLDNQPAKGRKGMWMDSARRAAQSLSTGNTADVFCSDASLDICPLLEQSAILELDLLNQAEQTFLSECLLLWVIQYRMNGNENRERLTHAIIIEEAHHLLRAPPGIGDASEPVIHIALREVRELGESIILATQNASVVPVSVFGNQATTLAFHTKHAKDVSSTAQAMLLKDDAKDELGRLPVGEAIVRIPRWHGPLHIRVSHRPIAKGTVTDLDIRQHMALRGYSSDTDAYRAPPPASAGLNPIPRPDEEQGNLTESPSTQAPTNQSVVALSPTATPENQERVRTWSECSPLELAMMKDILENAFDGVVRRIHRLQISRRKGTAALKALQERALIKPATVYSGSSLIKLFDLTKEGRALCYKLDYGPLPAPTEGGVEHRYWVHHTAEKLKSDGWTVKTEYKVSDDFIVDIHAERNNQTMAVLIETGKSNAKQNITRALAASYSRILVVSDNPAVKATGESLSLEHKASAEVTFVKPRSL